MKLILITGSMGSGKSSVLNYLEKKDYPVFRADAQAKKFLNPDSPCYTELRKLFPDQNFLNSKGEFDRQKLAKQIFKDKEKKQALESLIHPLVQKAFKSFVLFQKDKDLIFYEAPLLSKKLISRFDKSILLLCSENVKKSRLIKKGWKETELEARWAAQLPDSEVLDKVDFVLDNEKDLNQTYRQVETILRTLKNS